MDKYKTIKDEIANAIENGREYGVSERVANLIWHVDPQSAYERFAFALSGNRPPSNQEDLMRIFANGIGAEFSQNLQSGDFTFRPKR